MNLIDMFDEGLENSRNSKAMAEAKRGLYYNVNKRKKAGISRDKDNPKAPTDQAWKDAAKTAKKEDVSEGYWQDALKKAEADRERRKGKPFKKNPASHDKDGFYKGDKDLAGNIVPKRKKQGVAEGAPELLKAEIPLVRHIERELADKGWQKSDEGYDKVFSSTMAMYRKFGNVDAIKKQGVAEAGSFSYGKPPRKGSVADLAAKKRKEQEKGTQPVEPKDQMVGVAKVTKGVAEATGDEKFDTMMGKISAGSTSRKNVDDLEKHNGSEEAMLGKFGSELLFYLESLCKARCGNNRTMQDRQDILPVVEKWNKEDPSGGKVVDWLADLLKVPVGDLFEFEQEFSQFGEWHVNDFASAYSVGEWDEFKSQWYDGYISNLPVNPVGDVPIRAVWNPEDDDDSDEFAEGSGNRCMQCGMINCKCPGDSCKCKPIAGWIPGKGFKKAMEEASLNEKWSEKYKRSINCSHPKGFSQKAHCDVSFNEYAGSSDEEARMYDAGEFGDDSRDEMESSGQVTESPGVRLKDLANVATNMPDADFWLIRKGSSKAVGTPIKEYEPGRIGIKVLRTDILDPKYLFYVIMHLHNQGYFSSRANGMTNLVNIKVSDVADIPFGQQGVAENFADGRNPQDKGDSKRHGVPTKSSVSTLRKVAKQGGRKGQLAHWMANMKAGRAKSRAASEGANLDMANHMIKEQPADALSNLESILANVRRITGQYRRADMHLDIIMQVEKLALAAGINPTELKYYIDDILEKQREMEHAVNSLDEPFEYAVSKLADQNDGLAESQANKKKEIGESETKKRKFEYKPIEQSVIKDPEEYARWRALRELDHVFGPSQRHRAMARNGMYKKNIATPRQWKLLFDLTDEHGNINPRVSDDFVGEELTGVTAIDNDIKSIDQGVDENSVKPIFKGHYVYNVTPADVQDAQAIGLKQARDGHWIIAVYNTSGTKTVLKKQSADRAFGTGKWIAANVMRENKQTAVGLNENRVYYHIVGTSEKQLRSEFQLQQDEYGWYLSEDASPSLKLEALRTFGQPTSVNFMVEYDLAAFSGSTQALGPDNVVSPVGSLPKTQKKKGK